MPKTFHNPYNFVRTPSRTEAVLRDPFAGDHDPSDPKYQENHSRYWAERYTGVIPVRLRTQTPLFITNPETRRKMEKDREKEEGKAHYIYDCLEYIPAAALKGMLSSAYEIITNSRYRVFGKQNFTKLKYRDGWDKKTYPCSPAECLPDSLHPAKTIEQLSPADRLFGWVAQERPRGHGAWRGKLRFSNGVYEGEGSPIEKISEGNGRQGNGRPLKILGEPKPAQARFYLGDASGGPQADGQTKEEAGYKNGKKLRGRKVYLHHRNFSSSSVFTQEGNKQNRSITGWIPAGKEFSFSIRFENLTGEELGGLLILLEPSRLKLSESESEHPCYFRLGYGKPLGLGSVTLSPTTPDIIIFSGEEMATRYRSLEKGSVIPEKKDPNLFIDIFLKAMSRQSSLLSDFIKVGEGVDGTIAYSIIEDRPDAPIYEWFVANERGEKRSLPSIGRTLPSYLPRSRSNAPTRRTGRR